MKESFKVRKKVIIAFAVGIVLIAATIGITLAVNKNTAEVTNTFTVGEIVTNLIEPFYKVDEKNFVKKPQVVNKGQSACLVRVRYDISPSDIEIEITGFGDKWGRLAGGWYYYSESLAVGDTTQPLFEHVEYTGNVWRDFDIQVYQESVQTVVNVDGEMITDPAKIWELYDAGELSTGKP